MAERRKTGKEPDPVDIHIGRGIRLRRLMAGLSPAELARRLRLSPRTLERYEAGDIAVSVPVLWRLARAFDVPPASFFDGMAEGGPADGLAERLRPRAGEDPETAIRRAIEPFLGLSPRVREIVLRLLQSVADPPGRGS